MTNLTLLRDYLANAFELSHADRRLKIAHTEIPAELFVDKAPLLIETQVPQVSAAIRKGLVVRQHHAAFARYDLLVGVEADGGDVAQRTYQPPCVALAMLFGGILDDEQIMSTRQLDHRVHVDRQTVNMNDHNGLGTACNLTGDQRGVHVPRIVPAVDDNREGARAYDGRGAGDDCKARKNDLVTGPDAQRRERQFNGYASVTHRDTVRAAHQLGEPGFEFLDKRAFRGNPTRINTLVQVFLLVAVEQRPIDWNHSGSKFSFGGNSTAKLVLSASPR